MLVSIQIHEDLEAYNIPSSYLCDASSLIFSNLHRVTHRSFSCSYWVFHPFPEFKKFHRL